MKKLMIISCVCMIFGLSGCHQSTTDTDIHSPATASQIDLPSGPCTESGVLFAETKDAGNGYVYRKCWSSNAKKFASEIYKSGEKPFIYMIPTLPPRDEHDRFSPAIEQVIQEKITRSETEEFIDKENIGNVKFVDLNFDGQLDVLIYKGTYEEPVWVDKDKFWDENDFKPNADTRNLPPQKYYDGYLWNTEKKRFVYENELHNIANPIIDTKAGVIRMMRNVKLSPMGTKDQNDGESDLDPENSLYDSYQQVLRYQREFVELKYESDHYVFSSAVTFVSCGDYIEERGSLSIIGSHSRNKECLYSEYSYENNKEHRIRAYVPVDDLSPEWVEYMHSLRTP